MVLFFSKGVFLFLEAGFDRFFVLYYFTRGLQSFSLLSFTEAFLLIHGYTHFKYDNGKSAVSSRTHALLMYGQESSIELYLVLQ